MIKQKQKRNFRRVKHRGTKAAISLMTPKGEFVSLRAAAIEFKFFESSGKPATAKIKGYCESKNLPNWYYIGKEDGTEICNNLETINNLYSNDSKFRQRNLLNSYLNYNNNLKYNEEIKKRTNERMKAQYHKRTKFGLSAKGMTHKFMTKKERKEALK